MLTGGADMSGGKADGPANHVALVVGREDAINGTYENVGVPSIHMSDMSDLQRVRVRRNLDLSSSEARARRFRVGRRNIEKAMRERMKSGKERRPGTSIHRSFDSYWFGLFRDELVDFAVSFREDLSDIAVETDADMRQTVKNWKLNGKRKGRAHELSDAVAWFNQKGVKIRNCKNMDLRDSIMKSMERHLLK